MANAGDSLRAARRVKNLTQSEASDRLGVSTVTLSSWEHGKTEPILSQLVAMSRLYGISIDALCGVKPLVG